MNPHLPSLGGFKEKSRSRFTLAGSSLAGGFSILGLLVPPLYALLLTGFPLISPLSQILGVDSRSVSIPYRLVYLALSLLVILWGFDRHRYFTGHIWAVILPFWCLLIFRMVSDLTTNPSGLAGLSPGATASATEAYEWTGGVVLIPMLAFGVIPTKKMLQLGERLMFALLCASSLLLLYFGWGGAVSQQIGRLSAGSLGAISVGHVGASLLMLSLLMAVHLRHKRAWMLLLPSGLLGFFLLLAADSRGPQLATAIFFALYTLIRKKGWKLWAGLALATVLLFYSTSISVEFIENNSTIKVFGRWSQDKVDVAGSSSGTRVMIMESAWNEFLRAPVLGSTWVEPNTLSYPHNIAVESLMATGIIGGCLLCLMVGVSASRAVLIIRKHPEVTWIAALYIQSLVLSMTSGGLYVDPEFWAWSLAVIIAYRVYAGKVTANRPGNHYSTVSHWQPESKAAFGRDRGSLRRRGKYANSYCQDIKYALPVN